MENYILKLLKIKDSVRTAAPLVHCITNPISINDCANAVLALGAKPIMAEHPLETADIAASAEALSVSLSQFRCNLSAHHAPGMHAPARNTDETRQGLHKLPLSAERRFSDARSEMSGLSASG